MVVHVDSLRYIPAQTLLAKFYAAFVVPADPGLRASIVIHLGDFRPKLRHRYLVDESFHVEKGKVFATYAHKIARWEVEASGLEQDALSLSISGNVFSYLVFPYETIHQFLIFKLGQEGAAFLHALGVSKGGKGQLVIGRSGIGKSLLAGKFLRDGYRLLGDDSVFVTSDGHIHGFPLPLGIRSLAVSFKDFGFQLTASDRIFLALVKGIKWVTLGRIGLLFKVSADRLGQERLVRDAVLETAVFGLPSEKLEIVDPGNMEAFLDRIAANSRFENVILSKLIEAYTYIFPDSPVGHFWENQRVVIRTALSRSRSLLAYIPSRLNEDHYQSMKKELEHG